MLIELPPLAAVQEYNVAIEVLDAFSDGLGHYCRLYSQVGLMHAKSWIPIPPSPSGCLTRGKATLLPLDDDRFDHLLMNFTRELDLPVTTLFSSWWCPIEGVHAQTAALIEQIESIPLRRLVGDALLHPHTVRAFWSSPASKAHHHAYPGGLALHSLEVATMAASANLLTAYDRDLAIAFALLHDYGKVWCYANPKGIDSRTHERIGLQKLGPLLAILHAEAPDIGAALEDLLGGKRASRHGPYPLAIGRVVKAFDQMSCEMAMRPRLRQPTQYIEDDDNIKF